MAGFEVRVQWDAVGMRKLDRTLGSFQGKQLAKDVEKAMGVAVRPMASALKAAELGSGIHNRTGNLLRGIRSRKLRKRPGEMAAVSVGAFAPHARMVIPGHRIVTRSGRDTGARSQPFPFVDPVIDAMAPAVVELIGSIQWAEAVRRI